MEGMLTELVAEAKLTELEVQRAERQGRWLIDDGRTLACTSCGAVRPVNRQDVCQDCAFLAKIRTVAVVAAPWGLREVRRQHGVSGESDRADQERKLRRAEAAGERD